MIKTLKKLSVAGGLLMFVAGGFVSLAIFNPKSVSAADCLTEAWSKTSNPPGGGGMFGVAVDNSYVYATGYDNQYHVEHGNTGLAQWRLEKRAVSDGNLSATTQNNPSLGIDYPGKIAVDATGIYVVGGDQMPGINYQARIQKYDLAGTLIAQDTYNPGAGSEAYSAVALDANYVYLVGNDISPGTVGLILEKRSKNDITQVVTRKTWNPSIDTDKLEAVAVWGSSIYIAGMVSHPLTYDDMWRVEKRSLSNFDVLEASAEFNPSTNDDLITSIHVDSTGVYLAGYENFIILNAQSRWRIEKRTLDTLDVIPGWSVVSDPSATADQAYAITADNSYVYVAGYDEIPGNREWRIEKRDKATGSLVCTQNNNYSTNTDIIKDIKSNATGLYAVGSDNTPGNTQIRIVKYATGAPSPADPTTLSVTTSCVAGALNVAFNWTDAATNETAYYVDINGAAWTGAAAPSPWGVKTLGANATGFTWNSTNAVDAGGDTNPSLAGLQTTPELGRSYYWRVIAYNSGGGSYSNHIYPPNTTSPPGTSFATPATCTPPADPSNLTATPICASGLPTYRFTWTDNATNETAYYLDINGAAWTGAGAPSPWGVKTLGANTTGFTWSSTNAVDAGGDTNPSLAGNQTTPENGRSYYWRLIAYNSANGLYSSHVYPGGALPGTVIPARDCAAAGFENNVVAQIEGDGKETMELSNTTWVEKSTDTPSGDYNGRLKSFGGYFYRVADSLNNTLLGGPGSLERSNDDGVTWTIKIAEDVATASGINDYTMGPDGTLWAIWGSHTNSSVNTKIYKSTDNGNTWSLNYTYPLTGLDMLIPVGISVHPTNPNIIVVTCIRNGSILPRTVISTDGGNSWSVKTTMAVGSVTFGFWPVITETGRIVVAGGGSKIQVSDDNGNTWITKYDRNATGNFGIWRFGSTLFYLTSDAGPSDDPGGAIIISNDNGETWNVYVNGGNLASQIGIAFSPWALDYDGNKLYVAWNTVSLDYALWARSDPFSATPGPWENIGYNADSVTSGRVGIQGMAVHGPKPDLNFEDAASELGFYTDDTYTTLLPGSVFGSGDTIYVKIKVKNTGQGNIVRDFKIGFYLNPVVEPTCNASPDVSTTITAPLLAGQTSADWTFEVPSPLSPGYFTGYAFADYEGCPKGQITESSETNNTKPKTYRVDVKFWFEGSGGGVGSQGAVSVSQNPPVGGKQSNYLVAGANVSANVNSGWKITTYTQRQVPTVVYPYMKELFYREALKKSSVCNFSTYSAGANYCNTNAIFDTGALSTVPVNGAYYWFVDGDLNINSNVVVPNATALVFIVRGDVFVKTSVTRVDGIYVAGQTFHTQTSDTDFVGAQLAINGAVYTNRTDMQRILGGGAGVCGSICNNATDPAIKFNFDPKYLIMLSSLETPSLSWNEVAP